MITFQQFNEGARQQVNRWMVKCPYCKRVFAITVSPWQSKPEDLRLALEKHVATCPTSEVRIRFRIKPHYQDRDLPEFQDPAKRARAIQDMMGTDWKVEQVTGAYNPDIKCGAKCRNSKGPQCDCSCAGANHGAGFTV